MVRPAINQPDERYNRTLLTRLIAGPTALPVSLQEAKEFLAVTTDDQDVLIDMVLRAATLHVEQSLRRALMPQTWEVLFPNFPCHSEPLTLILPPTLSVISVSYFDLADVLQTWSTANYDVVNYAGPRAAPAQIKPKNGISYPDTFERDDAVTVRFQAGYANAEEVPRQIRHAIFMLLAHWHENREAVSDQGVQFSELPHGYKSIVHANRWLG